MELFRSEVECEGCDCYSVSFKDCFGGLSLSAAAYSRACLSASLGPAFLPVFQMGNRVVSLLFQYSGPFQGVECGVDFVYIFRFYFLEKLFIFFRGVEICDYCDW